MIALDEVKPRQALRAKMAKEVASIKRNAQGFSLRPIPSDTLCVGHCRGWGHIARNCKSERGGARGRDASDFFHVSRIYSSVN